MWVVYIVRCKDNSFYCGITQDVKARVDRHNEGKGAKFTRTRKPVELLYSEELPTKSAALKREIEIKNFSRKNKIKLIKQGTGDRFLSANIL